MENKDEEEKKIPLHVDRERVYVFPSRIEYLESVKNEHKTIFHFSEPEKNPPITATGCISTYLQQLPPQLFCMVHRSFVIHTRKIKAYDLGRCLTMDSGAEVSLSEQGKQNLID